MPASLRLEEEIRIYQCLVQIRICGSVSSQSPGIVIVLVRIAIPSLALEHVRRKRCGGDCLDLCSFVPLKKEGSIVSEHPNDEGESENMALIITTYLIERRDNDRIQVRAVSTFNCTIPHCLVIRSIVTTDGWCWGASHSSVVHARGHGKVKDLAFFDVLRCQRFPRRGSVFRSLGTIVVATIPATLDDAQIQIDIVRNDHWIVLFVGMKLVPNFFPLGLLAVIVRTGRIKHEDGTTSSAVDGSMTAVLVDKELDIIPGRVWSPCAVLWIVKIVDVAATVRLNVKAHLESLVVGRIENLPNGRVLVTISSPPRHNDRSNAGVSDPFHVLFQRGVRRRAVGSKGGIVVGR